VFYEPRGVYRGRDGIERVAGAIKATHPDFRYQPIAPPEELGDGGRIRFTRGLISSLPGTAGLPPVICFSTSYLELDFAVPRNRKGVERSLRTVFVGEWRR
jgi:hypothetical protein